MRFIALIFALLFSYCANAQVVFDAKSGDTLATLVNSVTYNSHTVGSGTNRALVVQISTGWVTTQATISSVTWDNGGTNQAMSLINGVTDTPNGIRTELWGLVAPTSGNKSLLISLSGATNADIYVSAVSFTGADQTGSTTTFAHAATGANPATSAVSLAVTSATGDQVVGALNTFAAGISTVSGTQIFIDNNGVKTSAAAMYASGAATVTLTSTPNNGWVLAGVDVVAASGGGPTCLHALPLTGGGC